MHLKLNFTFDSLTNVDKRDEIVGQTSYGHGK